MIGGSEEEEEEKKSANTLTVKGFRARHRVEFGISLLLCGSSLDCSTL